MANDAREKPDRHPPAGHEQTRDVALAGSLLIQCSIFCMVIVIVGELPAVLLYETQ